MKIGVLLSIRDKSSRFPGKVLKSFHKQTVTEHLVDRLKMCKRVDAVVIATSVDSRDSVFVPIAERKGVDVFMGSEEDKLLRYYDLAVERNLDAVIITDGDDILCFPEYIDKVADQLRLGESDAVFCRNLPLGAAASGLTKGALQRVLELKAESDTEVWGGYFLNGDRFKVSYVDPESPLFAHPEIRLTLDYQEDFDFFQAVFDRLYPANPTFSSADLMELLINQQPELNELNALAQKKYENNISKAAPVKFKEGV